MTETSSQLVLSAPCNIETICGYCSSRVLKIHAYPDPKFIGGFAGKHLKVAHGRCPLESSAELNEYWIAVTKPMKFFDEGLRNFGG